MFRKVIIAVVAILCLVLLGVVVYFLHFSTSLKNSKGEFQPLTGHHILQDAKNIAEDAATGIHSEVKKIDEETKVKLEERRSSNSNNTLNQESVNSTQKVDNKSSAINTNTEAKLIPSKIQMTVQKSKELTGVQRAGELITSQQQQDVMVKKPQQANALTATVTAPTVAALSDADMQNVIGNDKNLLVAVGTLKYQQNKIDLHTLNSGALSYVRDTAAVEKGDLLYKLSNIALEHKLSLAIAREAEIKKSMEDSDSGQSNIDVARKESDLRLKLLLVQAEIFAYKNSLKQTNFYAPFSGKFVRANDVSIGSQVQVGTLLGTLNGKESIAAVGMVSAAANGSLVLGQPVLVTLMRDTEKVYPAVIAAIDNNKDYGYIIHATIDGNTTGLQAGTFVKMHVLLP
jgi:hypothetical protein